MNDYLQILKEAVTAIHGCDCCHTRTSRVIETVENHLVFNGKVETFRLIDHPSATEAFAWSYDHGAGFRHIAILNVAPISDPSAAVKSAIRSGNH